MRCLPTLARRPLPPLARGAVLAVAAVVAGACASAPPSTAAQRTLPQHAAPDVLARTDAAHAERRAGSAGTARSGHYLIAADLLRRTDRQSLFELVAQQWPTVLRPLVPISLMLRDPYGDVVGVYADDGSWLGGQDVLRGIAPRHVEAVRRLRVPEEYQRFGRQHAGGALVITFRRPTDF